MISSTRLHVVCFVVKEQRNRHFSKQSQTGLVFCVSKRPHLVAFYWKHIYFFSLLKWRHYCFLIRDISCSFVNIATYNKSFHDLVNMWRCEDFFESNSGLGWRSDLRLCWSHRVLQHHVDCWQQVGTGRETGAPFSSLIGLGCSMLFSNTIFLCFPIWLGSPGSEFCNMYNSTTDGNTIWIPFMICAERCLKTSFLYALFASVCILILQ